MALAMVQAIKVESASGSSITVTNAWTVTAGNLLVANITFHSGAGGTSSASGGNNGTFTQIGTAFESAIGVMANSNSYRSNAVGGTENLTVTVSSTGGLVGIFHEISGADQVAPFTSGENNTNGDGTANPQTGSVTNSAANSIFIGSFATNAGANPITDTLNQTGSSPTTWAEFDSTNSRELNGLTFWATSVVYFIASSSAASSHGWTSSLAGWASVIADFKQAASGGSGQRTLMGAGT